MKPLSKLFRYYDPLVSFSEGGEDDAFRLANGASSFAEDNQGRMDEHPDTFVLKKIASTAVRRLREKVKDESLQDAIALGLESVGWYRTLLVEHLHSGKLNISVTNERVQALAPQDAIDRIGDADDFDIVNCAAALFRQGTEQTSGKAIVPVEIMYLCVALKEIDGALTLLRRGGEAIASYAVAALDCVRTAEALSSGETVRRATLTEWARNASTKRLKDDPRQAEKLFIRKCWNDWKISPKIYRSKAAFARDMVDKCEYLKSTKVVEDWCREWEQLEANG